MRTAQSRKPHGFTLIELMIAVGIIGMLASVAIPNYVNAQNRARAAERLAAVAAIQKSLNAFRVKEATFAPAPAVIAGVWNPALPAIARKRPFSAGMAGWSRLDLIFEGGLYYSYSYIASEVPTPYFFILVQGDLDGDGNPYSKSYRHDRVGESFQMTQELPPYDPADEYLF